MNQQSPIGYDTSGNATYPAQLLSAMDHMLPWAELEKQIRQVCDQQNLEVGCASSRVLRVYLLQLLYDMSDAGLEEALCDSAALREFVGVEGADDALLDQATIGRYRKLLTHHGIGEQILAKVQRELGDHGVIIREAAAAEPKIIASERFDFRQRAQTLEPNPPARTANVVASITVTPHPGNARQSQPVQAIPAAIELALADMGVGIFEYDPIAGIYQLSDRCKVILGLRIDDDPHMGRIEELMHADDRHLMAALCDSLRPDGPGRYSIEHRIIRPDGALRWVQVCGRTVFEETASGPRAVRSHGTMRDITERRQIEQDLYERESQLSAFVDGAPVAIAMFDRDMRYLAVSHQYAGQIGFTPAELFGRCAYDVLPDLPERWVAAHKRCLAGASERCDVDFIVRPDGSSHWVRWDLRPWYKADQTVGGLILLSEVITERIQAQQQLRESEARLELAIRAGALGIYDYNLAKGTTSWDARVRELWGAEANEEITYETFLGGLHPDDREPTVKALEESLGTESDGTHAAEYRVVHRKDGTTRWVSSTGTVFFEGGRAVRLVGIVQDITDRKQAELALAQSTEELRQADQRKDAFIATLSHELRNPLAPVRLAAQILASPKLKDEQLTWARQVIQRQTTHMASLLDDLLDVARITRGKMVLKKQEVRLTAIVESAVEAARPLIDQRQHHLVISLPTDPPIIDVDGLRLSQVISNLLTNAAKYTEPQGQIELSARVDDTTLTLSVKDNGVGIPREALGQIFTMFWQLEGGTGPAEGGLGIGLAFVKGLVELHDGTIEARSDGAGRGSEFVVRLPRSKPKSVVSSTSP